MRHAEHPETLRQSPNFYFLTVVRVLMNPYEVFREEIRKGIREVLGPAVEFRIEEPAEGHGDLCVRCFAFARVLRQKPEEIATTLADKFRENALFEKVVAEGGYLNFYLDRKKLAFFVLDTIFRMGENYGSQKKEKKIIVEHTSANPTGPLHVGRARNPIIGDTLARILRKLGYDVSTEYYVDDMGRQLAILAWAYRNREKLGIEVKEGKEDHALVEFYRKGNELFESNDAVRHEIEETIRRIESGDREIIEYQREIARKCMKGIIQSLEMCNVHIDNFVYESQFLLNGAVNAVIEKLKKSVHAGCEDGACYIDLKDFGFHGKDSKFFFTRKDGTSLYTTRDIAYHIDKFGRCETVINVLGEDHRLQAKMVEICLREMGYTQKPEVLFYSFVSLPEGKMSTRAGRVVYLDDLIEEAITRAREEVLKRRGEDEVDVEHVAGAVGAGAIRFNIVKIQPEKQIVFRWEDALNFEGNSAPFVQYAHARACSILRKAGVRQGDIRFDVERIATEEEISLMKVLARFPDIVEIAGEERKPYLVAQYLHKLAETFNTFYRYVPVLNAGAERDTRIAIVYASKCVLASGLSLLGIEALEAM